MKLWVLLQKVGLGNGVADGLDCWRDSVCFDKLQSGFFGLKGSVALPSVAFDQWLDRRPGREVDSDFASDRDGVPLGRLGHRSESNGGVASS